MKRKKSAAVFAPAFLFLIFNFPLFSQPVPPGKRVPSHHADAMNENPAHKNSPHENRHSPGKNETRDSLDGFPDSGQNPGQMMHYRGMRMLSSRSEFYVTKIEFEEDDGEKVKIEVKFSSQLNPRTVSPGKILLNGKAIPDHSKISFSKKGNKFEIEFPYHLLENYYSSDRFFTLSLGDIKSFSNVPLQESVFDDLYLDCEYEYHLYRRGDGIWFILREEDD